MREAQQQFEHLFEGQEGAIEVRVLPSGTSLWFSTAEWPEAAAAALERDGVGQEVYVGVAPRAERVGTDAYVPTVPFVWADVDDPEFKLDGKEPEPTMVVHSGNGWHLYWKLDEPVESQRARKLMRAIAKKIGGDKAVVNPSRILRVVGTFNRKGEPKPVELKAIDPLNTYSIEELEEEFGIAGELGRATGTLELEPVLGHRTKEFIDHGVLPDDVPERNSLVGIARNLEQCEYAQDDVEDLLWQGIQKHGNSDPARPWEERHIAAIVRSVYQTEAPPIEEREQPEEWSATVAPDGNVGALVPMSTEELLSPDDAMPYLVDGMLRKGEVVSIYGSPWSGKTLVAFDLAIAVSHRERTEWLGKHVITHGPVVVIDEEQATYAIKRRLLQLGVNPDSMARDLYMYENQGVRLNKEAWVQSLFALCEEVEPVLVIVDSLSKAGGLRDENDAAVVSQLFADVFLKAARTYDTTVLLIDHIPHGAERERGSSDKRASVDRAIFLRGIDFGVFEWEVHKARYENKKPESAVYHIVDVIPDERIVIVPREQVERYDIPISEDQQDGPTY